MLSSEDVTLQSYATVLAGLGAGLPLRRALELADVNPEAWGPACERWQQALDESAASDLSVVVAFDAALVTEQRRFEPTVEPISSDVAAWAAFRRHFLTTPTPVSFLAERQLSLGAYARLEADWTNRVASDKTLEAALNEQMSGPLGPCPELIRTPSPLLADAPATEAKPPSTLDAPIPSTEETPARANDDSEATIGPWSTSSAKALPFSVGAPASVGAAPTGPMAPFLGRRGDAVGDDDETIPSIGGARSPTLPFARREKLGEQTMLSLAVPKDPPLPFSQGKVAYASATAPLIQDAAAPNDGGDQDDGGDEGERMTALPSARSEPTLPFRVGTGTMPSAPSPAPAPTPAARPRVPSDVELTLLPSQAKLLAPTLPFARPAGEAGPPSGPPPPAPTGLPIERFAVIHAELEGGAQAHEVLTKHRLNALSWAGFDAAWRRRLAVVPEEAERAAALIQAVKARLAGK